MDEVLRYRLTGAIFLLAVAVIVLPMVFDGDGLPAVTVQRVTSSRSDWRNGGSPMARWRATWWPLTM